MSQTRTRNTLPKMPSRDAWATSWEKHWRKTTQPGYELPAGGDGERQLLATARTPQKERARWKRINDEFQRAFKSFYKVGPAVTVFGSARFKETHPYYKLARAGGGKTANVRFRTKT